MVDEVEEWRTIPGHESHQVSTLGQVRNARTGHQLKPYNMGRGYLGFRTGLRRTNLYIHRCVLLTFVGPAPSLRHQVAHGNGDRADNRLANLRWATVSENAMDRRHHGTSPRGKRFVSDETARRVVGLLVQQERLGLSTSSIGRLAQTSTATIERIRSAGGTRPRIGG